MYKEIIAVCFGIHAKHIKTPAGRRVCYCQASKQASKEYPTYKKRKPRKLN